MFVSFDLSRSNAAVLDDEATSDMADRSSSKIESPFSSRRKNEKPAAKNTEELATPFSISSAASENVVFNSSTILGSYDKLCIKHQECNLSPPALRDRQDLV